MTNKRWAWPGRPERAGRFSGIAIGLLQLCRGIGRVLGWRAEKRGKAQNEKHVAYSAHSAQDAEDGGGAVGGRLATSSVGGKADAPVDQMAALVSFDFHYLYVSAASAALFGRTPQELIGRDVFEFVHTDDRLRVEAFITSEELMWTGRHGVVYRIVRPGGDIAWCETVARLLNEKDPRYAGEHVLVHRLLKPLSSASALAERFRLPGFPTRPTRRTAVTDARITPSNWRAYNRLLDRDWARALLDGSPMSMLLIDVDHFALLLAHDRSAPRQSEPSTFEPLHASDVDEHRWSELGRVGNLVGLSYPVLRNLARRPLTSERPGGR